MRQKWGQRFLCDSYTAQRIVDSAELTANDTVIEIGPGRGALTNLIAARAGQLTAIEIDSELAQKLKVKFGSFPNVTIVQTDFLKYNLDTIVHPNPPLEKEGIVVKPFLKGEKGGLAPPETVNFISGKIKIIGNIPYAITGLILQKILAWDGWTSAVIMVQTEVGQRIVATPDDSKRGLLTLAVERKACAEMLFEVPKHLFDPEPEVNSAVIKLKKLAQPHHEPDDTVFFKVARAAFSQRRKQLPNTLSAGLNIPKETVTLALKELDLNPKSRPEDLSLNDFELLAKKLLG